MTTIGARIRNGCIGWFGNTRAEQVSPPPNRRPPIALSPGVVGLDRVAVVLDVVASVLDPPGDQTRKNCWSDEETRIYCMGFENR